MGKTIWVATAEPVNRYWHITVNGLGGATQARSAKEIDAMVRDFIEAKTDAPAESFDVQVKIQLPKEVRDLIAHAEQLRAIADQARKDAAAESRQAARVLKAEGLTVRDIGAALGVSHQRAQQLVKS